MQLSCYYGNMKKNRTDQYRSGQEWCQYFGLRPTKVRTLLFECLSEASRPQSVPEILEVFQRRKYLPNKTTLYRQVEQLVEQGVLSRVQLASERVSYELALDHHHHFVCRQCSQVTKLQINENPIQKVILALAADGKQVTDHHFEFFGICELCAV